MGEKFVHSLDVPPTAPTRALFFPDFWASREMRDLKKARKSWKFPNFPGPYFPGIRKMVLKPSEISGSRDFQMEAPDLEAVEGVISIGTAPEWIAIYMNGALMKIIPGDNRVFL